MTTPVWDAALTEYSLDAGTPAASSSLGDCLHWNSYTIAYGQWSADTVGSNWDSFQPTSMTISGTGLGAFMAASSGHILISSDSWGTGVDPYSDVVILSGFSGATAGIDSYPVTLTWDSTVPTAKIQTIGVYGDPSLPVSICDITFGAPTPYIAVCNFWQLKNSCTEVCCTP